MGRKCPNCGQPLKHEGKYKPKSHGHHPNKFRCKNRDCPKDVVLAP